MKFILLVEGHTEKMGLAAFLKRWLDPKLNQPVAIKIHRFEGWQDFWGRGPRTAQLYLDGPDRQDIVAVFGLLDLYGPSFPPERTSVADRYNWGVKTMEERADHPNFRMFFAVHELEAWILAQPPILPFKPSNPELRRMERPEAVNFREPPSYLLRRLYRENSRGTYKKTTDGPALFKKLDPNVVYDNPNCSYFRTMLDTMLALSLSQPPCKILSK